jgi:hypothetical protein
MKEHLSSQQLTDLAEGLLAPAQQEAAETHVAACQPCREALHARQALVERLREDLPAYLERVPPPALRRSKARNQVPRHKEQEGSNGSMWHRMRNVTAGAVVLALMVGLAIGLAALFEGIASPNTEEEGTPVSVGPAWQEQAVLMRGVLPPGQGPFGFQPLEIEIRTALPEVPEEIPLYRIEPALGEVSAETVRQWAEWLELSPVQVYVQETPGMERTHYIGVTDEWEMLTVYPESVSFVSSELPMSQSFFGVTTGVEASIDEATARTTAQDFVERLQPHLVVVETAEPATETPEITLSLAPAPEAYPAAGGFYVYRFEWVVDGVHIVTDGGMGNTIVIGPEGGVSTATVTPLRLAPTGETVPVRPPKEVVEAFLDGQTDLLRGSGWNSGGGAGAQPQMFYRSEGYEAGQEIDTFGWLQVLKGVEDGQDLLLMQAAAGREPAAFILEGVGTEALATGSQAVQVQGTLLEAEAEHVWRLQVENIGEVPPAQQSWEGRAERREDSLWLVTVDDQEFLLPEPPEEITDGMLLGALGEIAGDDPQQLEWEVLAILPDEDAMSYSGGGRAVEMASEVVESPPAEPTALPPTAVAPEGEVESIPVMATPTPATVPVQEAVVVAEPVPEEGLPEWWDYGIGDRATAQGILYVSGYRLPDGEAHIQANLMAQPLRQAQDAAGGEAQDTGVFYLPLSGDDETLEALLPLHQLHVRVEGSLLSPDEVAERQAEPEHVPHRQILWIEEVEQLWPEEVKGIFRGPVRSETVDGQEVWLLDDQVTDQTLALPGDIVARVIESQEDTTIALIGVLEPDYEIAGYQAVRPVEWRSGERASEGLKERLEDPLQQVSAGQDGPSKVLVDEVKLGYRALLFFGPDMPETEREKLLVAEPFYLLVGNSPDGKYRVTLRLAVTEMEATESAPASVPIPTPTGDETE